MHIIITDNFRDIIHMCSGIKRGRVHNGELYAQRFSEVIYLHYLKTDFSSIVGTYTVLYLFQRLRRNLHETVYKLNAEKLISEISGHLQI